MLRDPHTHRAAAVAGIDDLEREVTVDAHGVVSVVTAQGVYFRDSAGALVDLDLAALVRLD